MPEMRTECGPCRRVWARDGGSRFTLRDITFQKKCETRQLVDNPIPQEEDFWLVVSSQDVPCSGAEWFLAIIRQGFHRIFHFLGKK